MRECETVNITGGVSFVGNVAYVDGGAVSMDTLDDLHVDNATFVLNKAASGGAIMIVATTSTGSDPFLLRSCTFDRNSATDGGAVYLFNSARAMTVEESVFLDNSAGKGHSHETKQTSRHLG